MDILDFDDYVLKAVCDCLCLLKDRGSFRRTCKRFSNFYDPRERLVCALLRGKDQAGAFAHVADLKLAPKLASPGFLALASFLTTSPELMMALASLAPPSPRLARDECLWLTSDCLWTMFCGGWPAPVCATHETSDIIRACGTSWAGAEMMLSIRGGKLNSYYWIMNYMTPLMYDPERRLHVPWLDSFFDSMPGIIDLEYFFKFVDAVIKPAEHETKELLNMHGTLRHFYKDWVMLLAPHCTPDKFPRIIYAYRRCMKSVVSAIRTRTARGFEAPPHRKKRKTPEKRYTKTD